MNIIKGKAVAEWPDDFAMQRYVINQQTDAAEQMLYFLINLDQENPIIKSCISKALGEWPDDFEMQLHVFNSQMEAAPKFFEYEHAGMPSETLEGIKTKAFSDWPDDFEMMLHTLFEQVDAWEELYG
ncbi:MAG: hypothetical protein ACNA7O_12205 [Rhodobacterales bacterium]